MRTWAYPGLLLLVWSCGGGGGGSPDGSIEGGVDANRDTETDAHDATPDAIPDVEPDGIHADDAMDAEPDAGDASDTGDADVVDTGTDALMGETCEDAIAISTLPFSVTGTTEGAADDFQAEAGCPNFLSVDTGGLDVVYKFTPTENGAYTLGLPDAFETGPTLIYLVTDCADVSGTCAAFFDAFEWEGEGEFGTFRVLLVADVTYYIVVDGFADFDTGVYTLTVDGPCETACAGRVCGDDGCGGTCGDCETDKVCSGDGLCLPAEEVEGATCVLPRVIATTFFSESGDTTSTGDEYFASSCPGIPDGTGLGGPEVVYAFIPEASGVYDVYLESSHDASVYVTTDCASIGTSCLAGSDEDFFEESFAVSLEAGTTYNFIVDGTGVDAYGEFWIELDGPCIPACDGLSCGPDGCGLTCGACASDEVCETGACRDAVTGELCEAPIAVATFPYSTTGDTTGSGNERSSEGCGSLSLDAGEYSDEEFYEITPTFDWIYDIVVTPSPDLEDAWDAAFYLIADCDAASCAGGADDGGPGDAEGAWAVLNASSSYLLVVDGFNEGDEGPYGLTIEEATQDCDKYCVVVSAACSGDDAQYAGEADCLFNCEGTLDAILGAAGDETGDSLACRMTHAIRAMSDATTHCPYAGPSGGDVCVD